MVKVYKKVMSVIFVMTILFSNFSFAYVVNAEEIVEKFDYSSLMDSIDESICIHSDSKNYIKGVVKLYIDKNDNLSNALKNSSENTLLFFFEGGSAERYDENNNEEPTRENAVLLMISTDESGNPILKAENPNFSTIPDYPKNGPATLVDGIYRFKCADIDYKGSNSPAYALEDIEVGENMSAAPPYESTSVYLKEDGYEEKKSTGILIHSRTSHTVGDENNPDSTGCLTGYKDNYYTDFTSQMNVHTRKGYVVVNRVLAEDALKKLYDNSDAVDKIISKSMEYIVAPEIQLDEIGTILEGSKKVDITGAVKSYGIGIKTIKYEILNTENLYTFTLNENNENEYVNLADLDINNELCSNKFRFDELEPNKYTFRITAENSGGTTQKSIDFIVDKKIKLEKFGVITYNTDHIIKGTASSNVNIDSIEISIIYKESRLQYVKIYPNTKTVDLSSDNINDKLHFNELSAGSYTLNIILTDSEKTVTEFNDFIVEKIEKPTIILEDIGTITEGDPTNITGSVEGSTRGVISDITAKILSGKNEIQTCKLKPYTAKVNLADRLNKNLKFEELKKGSYTLTISATNSAGTEIKQIGFNVKTITKPTINLGSIGKITEGDIINITGTVEGSTSAKGVINCIKIEIINKKDNRTVEDSAEIFPEAKSVDLKSIHLDFEKLKVGSYKLKVKAINCIGTTEKSIDFSVDKMTKPTINLGSIGKITEGDLTNITGTVEGSTRGVIFDITVKILFGKNEIQTYTLKPYTAKVNLADWVNKNLKFEELKPNSSSYTLNVKATNCIGTTEKSIKFSVVKMTKPTIKLSSIAPFIEGYPANVKGTVSSNGIVNLIKAEIFRGSELKQIVEYNPNEKKIDLENSAINTNLNFRSLSAGKYTLKVTAINRAGATESSINIEVIEPEKPTITLSGINPVVECDPVTINGTVKASSKGIITRILFEVVDGKTVKDSVEIYPNSKTVDLKSYKLNFNKLAPGKYTLKVIATSKDSVTNCAGTSEKSNTFTVKELKKPTIKLDSIGSIIEGNSTDIKGTVQSNGVIDTIKAEIYLGAYLKQSATINQMRGIVDLKNSGINNDLHFEDLQIGQYMLIVTAENKAGKVTATIDFKVYIVKKQIKKCTINLSNTLYTYDGTEKKPTVTVKDGKTKLKEGTDYSVKYANCINAGSPTVTITATKESKYYEGEEVKTYTISPYNLANSRSIISVSSLDEQTYTGTGIEPIEKIICNGIELRKKDYKITYSNNVDAGTATAKIEGKGNYSGTISKTFKIVPKSADNCKISFVNDRDIIYNGSQQTPNIKIMDGERQLINKQDYTVKYMNNTNVTDNAQAIITFTKNYTGNPVTKVFSIKQRSIESCNVSFKQDYDYLYDGTEKKPPVDVSIVLTSSPVKLNSGVDYTISYSNNISVGTAYVTITGKGNYKDSISKKFTILKTLPIEQCKIKLSKTEYVYDGNRKTPDVTVTGPGNRQFSRGVDYAISYSNNLNAGTASVKVLGQNRLEGSKTITFKIKKAKQEVRLETNGDYWRGRNIKKGRTSYIIIEGYCYGSISCKVNNSKVASVTRVDNKKIMFIAKDYGSTTITVSSDGDENHEGFKAEMSINVDNW